MMLGVARNLDLIDRDDLEVSTEVHPSSSCRWHIRTDVYSPTKRVLAHSSVWAALLDEDMRHSLGSRSRLGRFKGFRMNEIWLELVELIPALLWFALAVCLLVMFRTRLADLFTRLGAVEAMGIKLVCMRESIEAALDLAEKAPQWQVHVPPEDKRRVLDRARSQYRLIKGAQFLWVDDRPENNVNERRMFRQLDVDIDTVTDNHKALTALEAAAYDLVISDIARPGQTSGLDLTKDLNARGLNTPIVFYVGNYRSELGVPPYSFGITNRPDELLHLCLDVVSRKRDA